MLYKKVVLIVFIIVVFIAGFYFGQARIQKQEERGREIRQSGYKYINPLLECEIEEEGEFKELISFRNEINQVTQKHINAGEANHISVYFRDLNNGPWIGINEKEEFAPSSLMKTPLMISVFKQSETNPDFLKKKIEFRGDFDSNEGQNIKPTHAIEKGKTYTIEDLVYRMIAYSDNNASILLSREVDTDVYLSPYKNLGLPLPLSSSGEYLVRVKDYATFFRVLFNASYLDRSKSEKALEILSKSQYKDGLVAGVANGVTVAHKFGEKIIADTGEQQLHDCGIIYYPKRPYLLCVMTRGKDLGSLGKIIADISQFVYQEVYRQMELKK